MQSHPRGRLAPAPRLRADHIDWSDDISLLLAGFCAVIAGLQTFASAEVQRRLAIPDVSHVVSLSFTVAGFTIAGLLIVPRSRPFGVILGAGCSGAVALLAMLGARFDLMPIALGLMTGFVIAAVRLDRVRGRGTWRP